MKVLVIQSSSLSKVIQSTPIIRTLNAQFEAEVYYLTKSDFQLSITENPYLKRTLLIDQIEDLEELNDLEFDILVDLQNDRFSRNLNLTAERIIRHKNERFKEWLFLSFKINNLPSKHLVDEYYDLIEPLGIQPDSLGLDFFIPEKDEVEKDWLPDTHQQGYAAICIGAETNTQRLPTNRLIELCDRINKPIVLLGSENDSSTGEEVATFFKRSTKEEELEIEELNKKSVVFNACGKFNINQQASIIKNSTWVFTYDNESMHIAAAFKKKIYSIWGSSSPFFGEYPYRTQFTIFENKKLSCRPCSKTGYKTCPKGHFKCMNDLTFDFYLPD